MTVEIPDRFDWVNDKLSENMLKSLHWAMENERILARHGVFIDYVDPFGEL